MAITVKGTAQKTSGPSRAAMSTKVAGSAVTECTGGVGGIRDGDLERRYETACDPRLNPLQAVELLSRAFGEADACVGGRAIA